MLIKCPECELQISDKALSCPHCGYPLQSITKQRTTPRKKRMRLPNGFGQITKITGRNLRKPYRAMVTVGKTETGRPIQKILKPDGYFETYVEAYEALIAYNKNPYDLEPDISVAELYDLWSEEYFSSLTSNSSSRTITSAWAYCSSIYNMRAKDVRARHIKGCMENGTVNGKTASANTKSRIKSTFNLMLDYALEHEIVDKNYARTFTISDDIISERVTNTQGHIPFTDEELKILWDNVDRLQYVDLILLQIYSGWRPQELGLIELENVDMENWLITGGMKTNAGRNRVVPVHDKIRPIVKKYHTEAIMLGSKYLVNCTDTNTHRSSLKMTYDKYEYRFTKIRDSLNLNPLHRPHDPRKHFVTMAKKCEVNEYAIKYIIGHAIDDLTEKVYTERDVEWLVSEMEKIK